MLTKERLQAFLSLLPEHSNLKLEMDCIHGTAYLKNHSGSKSWKIDLSSGTIIGSEIGRLSSVETTIREMEEE